MAKVYLVGAGPGDEDLLTIKALKCIQKADVILYDRLVNKEILKHAKSDCDLIYCGKLPNYHTMK
jgi:uroporphyrin-III C-methyltransferase